MIAAIVAGMLVVPLAVLAADRDPAAQKPDWRGTGVIQALVPPPSSLHATRPVIVIEHEPIAGLMKEKMSMPFIAASTDLFRGFKVGDRISFGLKETPDALLVIAIQPESGSRAR